MNEVTKSNAVDVDAFAFNLVLSKTFEAILKTPELDDDSDPMASASATTEVNRTIATTMAQSITGFGL